jgi:hypothetical protein
MLKSVLFCLVSARSGREESMSSGDVYQMSSPRMAKKTLNISLTQLILKKKMTARVRRSRNSNRYSRTRKRYNTKRKRKRKREGKIKRVSYNNDFKLVYIQLYYVR